MGSVDFTKKTIWDFRNYNSNWEIYNAMSNFQVSHLNEIERKLDYGACGGELNVGNVFFL